jgi:hypothetical protein
MAAEPNPESAGAMIVFGAKQIRRAWVDEEWYFSVVDIVAALTDSENPRDYWYRLKQQELESSGIELSTFCRQLKLTASDGKAYKTDNSISRRAAPPIGSKSASVESPSDELTGEWKNRGVREHSEFAILTAEISKATFGVTPSQYKDRSNYLTAKPLPGIPSKAE